MTRHCIFVFSHLYNFLKKILLNVYNLYLFFINLVFFYYSSFFFKFTSYKSYSGKCFMLLHFFLQVNVKVSYDSFLIYYYLIYIVKRAELGPPGTVTYTYNVQNSDMYKKLQTYISPYIKKKLLALLLLSPTCKILRLAPFSSS